MAGLDSSEAELLRLGSNAVYRRCGRTDGSRKDRRPFWGALPWTLALVVEVDRIDGDMNSHEQNGSPMNEVHVRIGIHRSRYHTDTSCSALNGKPETFGGIEQMSREEAELQGLKHCRTCKA
ncbi:hypothetical protein [Streptomyces sp. NPDC090029]|uniref:hypothetical protein n=1 Tax=Streptomyces sp. NPDC090029 TaxID=3365924 RepID=UPI0038075D76